MHYLATPGSTVTLALTVTTQDGTSQHYSILLRRGEEAAIRCLPPAHPILIPLPPPPPPGIPDF
jgi:VCBS repeat-containing protein